MAKGRRRKLELPASLLEGLPHPLSQPLSYLSTLSLLFFLVSLHSLWSPFLTLPVLDPFFQSPLRHTQTFTWPRPIHPLRAHTARVPLPQALILTWNRLVAVCPLVCASSLAFPLISCTPPLRTTTCAHWGRCLWCCYSVNPQEAILCWSMPILPPAVSLAAMSASTSAPALQATSLLGTYSSLFSHCMQEKARKPSTPRVASGRLRLPPCQPRLMASARLSGLATPPCHFIIALFYRHSARDRTWAGIRPCKAVFSQRGLRAQKKFRICLLRS